MLYKDAFTTATRSLKHGKMRSILTMLGIVIGISSVIILMSVGRSAQDLILNEVNSIGSNLIFITPGAPSGEGFHPPAAAQGIVIKTMVARDADAMAREPSVDEVVAIVSGQAEAVYGNENKTVNYYGATANMFPVRNLTISAGDAFTESDVASGAHVAVIGPDLALDLFGKNRDPVGKTIRLKSVAFRVVGVLEKGGTGPFGADMGNLVIVPLTVAQKQLLGVSYFSFVIVEADENYDIDFVKSRITFALRQSHGITDPAKDDFNIQTQADVLSILGTITSVLTIFLAAVASISLLVGGIGIMNIMLVAVSERTREVGLRKSVGATDRDILQQFLIEAVLLTLAGGLIGILLGAGMVALIYAGVSTFYPDIGWGFALPLRAVLLALAVSSLAGIIFGIYPAREAAKKNPIDALRYE